MTNRIQRLADRMLGRFVPETKASAINCSYVYSGTCLRQYCCWGGEIPGGTYCGSWQYTC
ncbi:hypothetical protein AB0O28_27970 [Microbispora sp. NPDC088329]|uniref:hypothetical protein n=1 Tax=Microbispora sp. NPDC088329 TaxID=3154869 RepID=UPI00341466CB